MAEREAEGELSQRHLGVKEQRNAELIDSDLTEDESKQRNRQEHEEIVLWKKPLVTLHYFALELLVTLKDWLCRLRQQKETVFGLLVLLILLFIAYSIEGTHQKYVRYVETKTLWCSYWVGLGILSSVGLGTGLHTFLLYLGPHIASVTLAAYECGSVDFPEPPYPDQIVCPLQNAPALGSDAEQVGVEAAGAGGLVGSAAVQGSVSLWTIISKVRLEACMWGAGTAIGELPPYFMARAARLSGAEPDDQWLEEIVDQTQPAQDFANRGKVAVQKLIQRVGFFGILACASKLFVIVTFSRHIVEQMVSLIGSVPLLGAALQKPFREYLDAQKAKLHHHAGEGILAEESWLPWLFEKVVVIMVCFFVCSIVNSMAQNYGKRKRQAKCPWGKAE